MNSDEACNIYDSITNLSKQIFETYRISLDHSYLPHRNNDKIVKKLRSKAYEILLNKTAKMNPIQEIEINKLKDPIVELLKYAFVLKVHKKQTSKAIMLEKLINEFNINELQPESTIYSILQLLNELKGSYKDKDSDLNIFYYGKVNPTLPEDLHDSKDFLQFQTYPMEILMLPDKFSASIDIQRSVIVQQNNTNKLNWYYQDPVPNMITSGYSGTENIYRQQRDINQLCITDTSLRDIDTASYFSLQITEDTKENINYFCLSKELKVEISDSWLNVESVSKDNENLLDIWKLESYDMHNEVQNIEKYNYDWDSTDCMNDSFDHYTWETLGEFETPKEVPFITDTVDAMSHLIKIKEISVMQLLPMKLQMQSCLSREISIEEFTNDVILLLFGIESAIFKCTERHGFCMRESIAIHTISSNVLSNICKEFIHWGNCFRSLNNLIASDLDTGKLRHEGLIFKAMCTSIKELLLYYKASLLPMFSYKNESMNILSMLENIRPIALMITEVARLCQYDGWDHCELSENRNILTRIYKEVTKITLPQIALVFHAILKSCCEVYFQFLQKWLFEGVCDDVFEEFMIKERLQYSHIRGHKFWTKGFVIHNESVPGFLKRLIEPILQCGKTVRLLRICDPKNPVCGLFNTMQPELKVCLNITMLRQQLLRYLDYESKGKEALGQIVSFASAIQDQKDLERERANQVIRAQQDTLLRIKNEYEDLLKADIQKKQILLEELKKQVAEVTLHKEREKEVKLMSNKLTLEKANEKKQNQDHLKRTNLLHYYDKLNADVANRQAHYEWRMKRMNYFEKRAAILSEMGHRLDQATDTNLGTASKKKMEKFNEKIKETAKNENMEDSSIVNITKLEMIPNTISCEDENSNITETDAETQILNERKIPYSNSSTSSVCNNKQYDFSSKFDERNTKGKAYNMTSEIQQIKTPTYVSNMNYIYRQNNERSTLQDFLRDEAIKEVQAETNLYRKKGNIIDIPTTELYHKRQDQEQLINRPTVLKFGKLDNMIQAQQNKMKILREEYAMTPNNNESCIFFMQESTSGNQLNQNDNLNQEHKQFILSNNTKDEKEDNTSNEPYKNKVQLSVKMEENMNVKRKIENNIQLISGETLNTNNRNENMENLDSKMQLSLLNNLSEANYTNTPMSCTTDNITLSLASNETQLQTYEDVSPSEVSSEILTSCNALKSRAEIISGFAESFNEFQPFKLNTNITSDSKTSLTITDVDMLDNTSFQVYLEKSIALPLRIQIRLVNNAIIKYLLNEQKLLSHLHSLRNYFFLLNGEFAKSLTNSLYATLYEISLPVELFNSATLTHLLDKALIYSYNNNYVNSGLLSLSAIDVPMQLYISDPSALDCLSLTYKISWPLNIILDETVMLQYSKVFKFLIMIGRVMWVLQEDFRMMKIERDAATSEQYHKLQLYRHSMTQFMNALHNYITCSVLHASWTEFEKDLRNCQTLDQIYLAHVNYIKRILSRCMLNARGEKMRTCLCNVFKVILKFHNRLRFQEWIMSPKGYIHPNFKRLEQIHEAFCELRTYLSRVAFKLITSGYQPHLMHFLNSLNISHIYDITNKSS